MIEEINKEVNINLEVITPNEENDRGCQLSIVAHEQKENYLTN